MNTSHPTPPEPKPLSPLVGFPVLIAVYVIPLLAVVRPVTDWDLWWHLSVGQWIVENGTVTTNDPFSTYGAEKSWVAYSWLFEVLVYGLFSWLGFTGIFVMRLLLALGVVASMHRLIARREPRFLIAALWTAICALALCPLLSERPWLFTMLFCTWTLEVVLDMREGRPNRLTWFLPW